MAQIGSVVIASRCAWTTFNFRRGLIKELQQVGTRVLACGAGGDGYEERLESAGIRFVALPLGRGTRSLLEDLKYSIACYRLLRRVRPNVFHAFAVKPVILGSIAAALARVPIRVAMITGLGHAFTSSGAVLRGLIVRLYRLALRRVQLVYFQNAEDRDEFLRLGLVTAGQCRMIAGSGVDTMRFIPARHNAIPDEFVFVMVARALREKGIDEFLAAARTVQTRLPRVRFLLVGGTDDRNPTTFREQELRVAARAAGVNWVGQVDDVRPYLADADIVVLPSYREGTPMSLLEAAAMAKPMIATQVAGCTEIVREGFTGWLVPPRDSAALADAMLKAIAERGRWSEFGANARTLATTRFDSRLICRQIVDDYRELMARGAG